jgi:hypothetical protein
MRRTASRKAEKPKSRKAKKPKSREAAKPMLRVKMAETRRSSQAYFGEEQRSRCKKL